MNLNDDRIKYELEKFVDTKSLQTILIFLSQIAYAKSEHIRENWQDYNLADSWENDAVKISKIEVLN